MIKRVLILALCLSLLTACNSSSSSEKAGSSTDSNRSSSILADENMWKDIKYCTIAGASIPVPNGYAADSNSSNDSRYYTGPNDSRIHIMTEAFKVEMNEETAQKRLDEIKDSKESYGTTWSYTDKKSSIISICEKSAILISYHAKAESNENKQEWDESILLFNSNDTTVRISLQGDMLNEGNFKRFCELIETPGVKNAQDISFDDVNYIEIDELMVPVPKSFKVNSERDFLGENASIHYFSLAKLYDISKYGMEQEVEEIKKGYNEPDIHMYQDNDVHSSKLDFIGGKMAYYISYTAKIKGSADDAEPTVVERIDIYLNTSKQGVTITLSGDMTKDSNFKAFCEKIKYK